MNNFDSDLNSENNLKLTLKYVKDLKLIKNVSINKRILDIKPIKTKKKLLFISYNKYSDHIYYDLIFDGKNLKIIKNIEWSTGKIEYTVVKIKLKILLKLTKTN